MPTSLLALLALACSVPAAEGKGAEDDPSTVYGKGDSFYEPTVHQLELGGALSVEITDRHRYHAFDFELAAPSVVTLETAPVLGEEPVDTVMYLYRDGDAGWGRNIANHDDISDTNLFSRLAAQALRAGSYRVLIKGYRREERGGFSMRASCESNGCLTLPEEVPTERCRFGTSYGRFLDEPTFDTVRDGAVTSPDELTEIEQIQLLRAIDDAGAFTVEQAFEFIDFSELWLTERRDRWNGRTYVAVAFGAGENDYGAIFRPEETVPVATIEDGYLYHCTVDAGPGVPPGEECSVGDACTSGQIDCSCRAGLICEGISAEVGVCVLPEASATGQACRQDLDCTEHAICAGATRGPNDGQCVEYWMRRTFAAEGLGPIPDDGELEVTFHARGLASVDVDVIPSLGINHDDPAQLRVTLTNPGGTTVVLFDGEGSEPPAAVVEPGRVLLDVPVLGFSGDENVNGVWSLRIQDRVPGIEGRTRRAGSLTLSSRWD